MSTTIATATQLGSQPEIPTGTEITPEGLLRMPDGKHYELIDGELAEREMSVLSGIVAAEYPTHSSGMARSKISAGSWTRKSVISALPGNRSKFAAPMSLSSRSNAIAWAGIRGRACLHRP